MIAVLKAAYERLLLAEAVPRPIRNHFQCLLSGRIFVFNS
jgi:hypothetical protein